MTRRELVVVTAGLSQPSSSRLLADRLAAATRRGLEAQGVEADIQVIELRDHARDLTNNLLTGFPSQSLRAAITHTVQADGLIAVSPIFSASYSGLFKTFFDVLDADSLSGKPVLIAATGGTERHSLALEHALRPLFTYLRAVLAHSRVRRCVRLGTWRQQRWGAGPPHQASGQRTRRPGRPEPACRPARPIRRHRAFRAPAGRRLSGSPLLYGDFRRRRLRLAAQRDEYREPGKDVARPLHRKGIMA